MQSSDIVNVVKEISELLQNSKFYKYYLVNIEKGSTTLTLTLKVYKKRTGGER